MKGASEERSVDFDSAGFAVTMGVGDMFLLTGKKYVHHQASLGSIVFSKLHRRPIVRVFIGVCTGINY